MYLYDTFTNFLSGLGVAGRDKQTAFRYTKQIWTREQLEASYQSDWIARKAITIPAQDATREWRQWQAEQDQIEKLEETEQRLQVQLKLQEALTKARLYGGCCLLIGVDGNMSSELDPETIGKDGLKFIHVLAPHQLVLKELIKDISSPYYGQPEFYTLNDDTGKFLPVKIHPSRMIRFTGLDAPDPMSNYGWGDPMLQMINDAVSAAGTVMGSIAAMISEAKFDVVKIPGLTEIFSTTQGTERMIKRFTEANVAKSVINAVLLDGEEEWQRIGVSFDGMPEIMQMYLQIASGAADIPATRFLGRAPAGLNATGDSDLINYYDRIKSDQELRITPALERLDIAIQRSALGTFDENIFYEWNPLWQMTEAEKATIAKQKADTTKVDADTGLVPFEALVKGRVNQLIEDGTYPGLEAAIEEAVGNMDEVGSFMVAEAEAEAQAQLEQMKAQGPPGAPGQKPPPKQLAPPKIGDALRAWSEELHPRNEEGEFGSSAANRTAARTAHNARAVAALSFNRKLHALNVGMSANNYDRYKLINLHKKEVGPVRRGASVEEVVSSIHAHREQAALTGMATTTPEAFVAARDKSTRSQFLSAHPAEELAGHTLLTNKDNTVGISVDQQGDVQNVFNNGGPKGGAAKAMVAAIGNGGRTLDCYDGFLPSYYHQFGFEESSRMKFNREYAPDGWDYATHNDPDIVFMSWQGYHEGSAAGALARAANRKSWKAPARSTEYGEDWDAAKEASRQNAKRRRTGDHRDAGADARDDDRAGDRASARTGARVGRALETLLDALRTWNEEKHERVPAGQGGGGRFGTTGTGPLEKNQRAIEALHPKKKEIAASRERLRVAQQRINEERAAQEQTAANEAAKIEKATPSKEKKIVTKEAFSKAKLRIRGEASKQDEFVAAWNEKIGTDPEEFAKTFTGGLQDRVELSVGKSGHEFQVTGIVKDKNGRTIGNFDRDIKPDKKEAYSAYFKIEKASTGDDTGKKILGGNVEFYESIGIETVRVTANIDVGGYAWAKYGYVPTPAAWSTLSSELERKLDRETGESGGGGTRSTGDTYEAEEWDVLSSDQQAETERMWMRDSRDDFLNSEIDNWRESGQALEQTKKDLADQFNEGRNDWALDEVKRLRKERIDSQQPDYPFNDEEILAALQIDEYSSRYDDGRDDPEFTWDDLQLDEAGKNKNPNQMNLPGIEPPLYHKALDDDMRSEITDAIETEFNSRAESDANDVDPPDYLSESVEEQMADYWEQIDDSERLRMARNYGQADIEIESDPEDEDQSSMDLTEEEKQDPEIAELYDLVRGSNPKNLWKIADSSYGKKLLLNSGWSGVLDLKDKESYARFKAYVGRAKKG